MAEEQHRLAEDEQMPKIGTLLGDRYEIKSVLGEGGFAAVYKAFDTRTKTDVAVKVLDPIMSRRSEFSARFLREVSTVSQLRHHNTIKIFDSGETDNKCLYLVMELLRGKPLDEIIEDEGSLSPPRVKYIVQQILKSLYEAHEIGVIHRDLKPANVFIADLAGERDYVKVLDFGIAKSIDESQDSSLTATGQVMCSPDYVAPERVRDHLAYPASDLYSLGIMMIEMLDGELPYKGDSPMMVALQHVKMDEPVPMSEITANGGLGWVIRKACSKDLSQRYTSAAEMLDDLASVTFDGVNTQAQMTPGVAGASNNQTIAQSSVVRGAETQRLDEATDPLDGTTGSDGIVVDSGRTRSLIVAALVFVLVGVFIGGLVAFLNKGDKQDGGNAVATTASERAQQPAMVDTTGIPEERAARGLPPAQPVSEIITILSEPNGANVFLNDREIGVTPLKFDPSGVTDYPARLRFELDGHETKTRTIHSSDELDAGLSAVKLDRIEEAEPTELATDETTEASGAVGDSETQRARARREAERRRAEQARAEEARAEQARREAAAEAARLEAARKARAEEERQREAEPQPSSEQTSGPSRIIDLRPRQ